MNQNKQVLTSIEVAEMVGRAHNEVLKDIRQIIEDLGKGIFPSPLKGLILKTFLRKVHIAPCKIKNYHVF